MLFPFESRSATIKEVTTEAIRRWEEEQRRCVESQGEKVYLASCGLAFSSYIPVVKVMLHGQKPPTMSLSLPWSAASETVDFLGPDPSVKLELVDLFSRSWDLALFGSAEPLRVTKKQVAIAEAFARALKVVRSAPFPSLLSESIDFMSPMPSLRSRFTASRRSTSRTTSNISKTIAVVVHQARTRTSKDEGVREPKDIAPLDGEVMANDSSDKEDPTL
ncbi:LOW QUALITY PROTEIN: hypothetical protein Cgig2_018711 [Carnegiea gigantea]|uniref:Uncharacterized protein n=1 Tax=Carnegiea gigantea TaxID=171969 RepID=A0A9Q1KGH4_9CARY|nr:LOW QUALITY PROTEIN: hypothetical protein Cgig2_018711 [Carnegiea gigantea]